MENVVLTGFGVTLFPDKRIHVLYLFLSIQVRSLAKAQKMRVLHAIPVQNNNLFDKRRNS